MNEPTYVEQLRDIRDRIGRELQQMTWQEWETRARQIASQDPRLARLMESAEPTKQRNVV